MLSQRAFQVFITAVLFLFTHGFVYTQTYTVPGTYTWTVPPCVTEVTVRVWGAGGGGGGAIAIMRSGNDSEACSSGGGGGGGGYSSSTFTVIPGQTYTIVVGGGGSAGSAGNGTYNNGITTQPTSGGTGGTSSFSDNGINILATGGIGGGPGGAYNNNNSNDVNSHGSGSVGGSGSGGMVNFTGGNGVEGYHGTFGIDKSGGGGGAAGPGGNGNNAIQNTGVANSPGGTGQAPGGNGANGRYWNVTGNGGHNGEAGSAYGGGGSGAVVHRGTYNVERRDGGAGAHGAVIIEYPGGTTPPPLANDQSFCGSMTIADLVATGTDLQWYSSDTGGSPLVSTTPVTAGTYYVSQTINGCESDRVPVQVTIAGPSEPSATNQNFCAASAPTIADLTASGSSLQWYSQEVGGTPLDPTTPVVHNITYYVSQTVGGCESGRTPVLVTINNPAPPNASDQSFCSNEAITLADLTVQGSSVQWYSQGSGGTPLNPTTPVTDNTTYYVSQTVNECESDRVPLEVVINNTPVANAGNNSSIACDMDVQLGESPSANYEYSWSPAVGLNDPAIANPIADPALTTTYELTVTDQVTGCSSTSQVTVTVEDDITPLFTNPGPVCTGTNFILPTTSDNGVTGTWSPTVNNITTTTYTFTPDDDTCVQSVTMEVVVNNQVTPTFINPGPICTGANFTLPTTSNNGLTGVWSPAVNNTTTTIYTFTPDGGCSETITMEVVVADEVIPLFTNPGPVCTGTNFTLPSISDNGVTGIWSPAVNNTMTTTYTFTPDGGCFSTVTMTVAVEDQIIPTFQNPGPICSGASLVLPAVSGNGIAGTWTPAVNNLVTTTYTFVPDLAGCAIPATMEVVVIPNVMVSIAGTTEVCQGGAMPVIIFEAEGGAAPYTYTYSIGNGTSETFTSTNDSVAVSLSGYGGFNINNVGCYDITIEISAAGGCSNSAVFEDYLCVHANPHADFTVSPGSQSGNVTMNNGSVGATSYEWNFGDGTGKDYTENPTHNFSTESSETYTIELIAYNDQGCSDTAYNTIKIEEDLIFYVPNTFTPDGDEYNNIFKPVISSGYDLLDYSLDVYNRWGERIFTSHNTDIGWDGTYNGVMVQDGAYTWKITLKIVGIDDRREYVGHINIVR